MCAFRGENPQADSTAELRPEALETWYYAYRATKDPKYREWAWDMFTALNKVCRTDTGFSAISDVTKADGGQKLDKQESFVFAELLKYMWLIHVEVGLVEIMPLMVICVQTDTFLGRTC